MRLLWTLLAAIFFLSCSPAKRLGLKKSLEETEQQFQDHTGFMLYDLAEKKTVFSFNDQKYFTPASNTKILTFYTALRIIGDSVPALKYVERNDSLIFWGTGDPSLLYKYTFNSDRVLRFLSQAEKPLYFSPANYFSPHFGPGWSWDDYNDYYAAERSPLPLYGNIMSLEKEGKIFTVQPEFFQPEFSIGERRKTEAVIRHPESNVLKYHPGTGRTKFPAEWDIPIRLNHDLTAALLTDTIGKKVTVAHVSQPPAADLIFSIPTDSLYRVMMQESDNFIAEQLLLICADIVRDSLGTEIAIDYSIENFLHDLPDKPVWVDGSGLSRYNLFTPRSIVKLWEKIYELVPRERLFSLLAVGGQSGTLKNWYKGESPFIFGKTGSLSNNHSVSGFLVTKSGKTLVFAFMNNNFTATTSQIRKNMQDIFSNIYENY